MFFESLLSFIINHYGQPNFFFFGPLQKRLPITALHNKLPLVHTLKQINAIHTLLFYLRSILILPSHQLLCLTGGPFPSGFPIQTRYTFCSSPICATRPAHLILLKFIILITFSEEYRRNVFTNTSRFPTNH